MIAEIGAIDNSFFAQGELNVRRALTSFSETVYKVYFNECTMTSCRRLKWRTSSHTGNVYSLCDGE